MPDRGKVIRELEFCVNGHFKVELSLAIKILALLKEQEGIINELLDLGYPHNFQHEAPWVVDYLYELTEIIKKAFKAREGR